VRRGILETNFVRDIEGFGENDPRKVYYELARGEAADRRTRAAVGRCGRDGLCLLHGRGGDRRGLVRDVDLTKGEESCFVRGTKTVNRVRTVRLVEENRWLLPYIAAAIADKAPNAKVFPGLKRWTLLREQQKVASALEIRAIGEETFSQHTFHDWRHTRTVQLLRDGYEETVAAHDLGHEDVNLVRTTYGEFHRDARTTAASAPSRSSAPLPLPRPPSKLLH
jgi:hypothetical protein